MVGYYINRGTGNNTNFNDKLENILKDVGDDDEIIITMEGTDADRSEFILDFLEENGFEVFPKGGHDGGEYHLVAYRKKQ